MILFLTFDVFATFAFKDMEGIVKLWARVFWHALSKGPFKLKASFMSYFGAIIRE